ncbi:MULTISPECIES: hypothetical protein [unclassified Streptomyces]|uniref:hypothetical protein n=1 Tax=unclassified Streptomyces TaxID=2593676 RepID=UPI0022865890|nr:hypothetical protein [Streptomyces sp. Je 1-369]WAL97384.1 hypothetical protein NOO62_24550 [Streptomyces sp. Je 1-369]
MKSAVARVVAAVSVVVALGASAACGSGDGGGDAEKDAKPRASAGPSKLEKAALTAGDVKGYEVEKPDESGSSSAAAPPPAGKPSPTECGPLAAMLDVRTSGKARDHVRRILTATGGGDFTTTRVGLSSYAESDAKKTMADLRASARSKKCSTFRVGEERYIGVRALPSPNKGDEAVSYKIAHRKGEYVLRESVTVVRSGATLAVFDASNLYDPEGVQRDKDAEKDGTGGIGTPTADQDPKVAPGIVTAQLGKL